MSKQIYINRNGSNFFYYIQLLMLENIALTFAKLTDPKGQKKSSNLSLEQINDYARSNEEELVNRLSDKFKELKEACENFRTLRNKKIAHFDLEHALKIKESPLPGVSENSIEDALKILREYMDIVDIHYNNSQSDYEFVASPYGTGGAALIKALYKSESKN